MDNELVGGDEPKVRQGKNVSPMIVLGTLAVVAVILVVGVVMVKTLKNNDSSGCLKNDDTYDIETCINLVYDDKGQEDATGLYERAIDEAYKAGDEQKFYDLLMAKAEALVSKNGDCKAAASSIEDERVSELPNSAQKGVFYSEVIGLALTCNNTEMKESYTQKLSDLNNSGEIEIYAY